MRILKYNLLANDLIRAKTPFFLCILFLILAPDFIQAQKSEIIVLKGEKSISTKKTFWNLPQELNDKNSIVGLVMTTNWHRIEGKATGIQGKAWLENPKDYFSLRAEIIFPVSTIDTAHEERNKKMLEILDSKKYPNVTLKISGMGKNCIPKQFQKEGFCSTELTAELTIRDITKEMILPVVMSLDTESGDIQILGEIELDWTDFGIPDPGMVVTKLDKTMGISYGVLLSKN